MTGARKVVSKSYSCDVELAEKSNTLQTWSIICLLITKYKLGTISALFEGIKDLLSLLSNNVYSL